MGVAWRFVCDPGRSCACHVSQFFISRRPLAVQWYAPGEGSMMSITTARIAAPPVDAFARDVAHGLARTPKRSPSKYFYAAEDSRLFEAICEQPEYYLPRVGLALMLKLVTVVAGQLDPVGGRGTE